MSEKQWQHISKYDRDEHSIEHLNLKPLRTDKTS